MTGCRFDEFVHRLFEERNTVTEYSYTPLIQIQTCNHLRGGVLETPQDIIDTPIPTVSRATDVFPVSSRPARGQKRVRNVVMETTGRTWRHCDVYLRHRIHGRRRQGHVQSGRDGYVQDRNSTSSVSCVLSITDRVFGVYSKSPPTSDFGNPGGGGVLRGTIVPVM